MVIFQAAMTAIVFIQVVLRYIFNSGLSWGEEIARFLFMWIIWITMSFGFRDHSHIRMSILSDKLTPKGKLVLQILMDLCVLAFSIYMGYYGWKYVGKCAELGEVSSAAKLPHSVVFACFPYAMTICSIRIILDLIREFKKLAAKDYSEDVYETEADMVAAQYAAEEPQGEEETKA